jgi:carboxylesterase type B
VIWVAMNYRLNIFGFANSPALQRMSPKALNVGLLDQRLALEWIRDNIASFGGNPTNVTAFGQSDGATGVGLHITSYGGKGPKLPFQRAILESGGPTGDPGVATNLTMNSTNAVANFANCTQTNSTAQLECLRSLSWQDLLTAVIKFENSSQSAQDIFFPTLDGVHGYIPDAPSTLLREGRFHKNVSTIAGFNFNDGTIFVPPTLANSTAVTGYLSAAYPNFNSSTLSTLTNTLYPLQSFEAEAKALNSSPFFEQASQIYRDVNFACQALFTVQTFSHYSPHVPVYVYDFNTTSFGLLLQLNKVEFFGVIHTSEILFVYNNANFNGLLPITAGQTVTQDRVSGSWAEFASTGNPSGNNASTSLLNWSPAFTVTKSGKKGGNVEALGTLRNVSIRAIGGDEAGQFTATLNQLGAQGGGFLREEGDLLRRCEFINSPSVQKQIAT